jgi:putative FmdB family regulatory protein
MIYEYQCLAARCGVISEVVQRLSEAPLTKCPKCKRGKVIKLISLPAKSFVPGDFHDEVAKMKREAKAIAQKIVRGDEQAIADIYGDDVADKKPGKAIPKPKTLDQFKNSKIKRSKT